MSVYLPQRFRERELDQLDALIGRDPFVTLCTPGADGLPQISHIPVLYRRLDEAVEIRGHWARANPQSSHAGPALMIVHGPHAYISPRWYCNPEDHVPTWNYAVAHLRGDLSLVHDPDQLTGLVSELSARFEPPAPTGWQPQPEHPEFRKDLRGIVGFVFTVSRVDLKFKLNQHYDVADRQGVIDGLRADGDPQQAEIAALMHARLDQTQE